MEETIQVQGFGEEDCNYCIAFKDEGHCRGNGGCPSHASISQPLEAESDPDFPEMREAKERAARLFEHEGRNSGRDARLPSEQLSDHDLPGVVEINQQIAGQQPPSPTINPRLLYDDPTLPAADPAPWLSLDRALGMTNDKDYRKRVLKKAIIDLRDLREAEAPSEPSPDRTESPSEVSPDRTESPFDFTPDTTLVPSDITPDTTLVHSEFTPKTSTTIDPSGFSSGTKQGPSEFSTDRTQDHPDFDPDKTESPPSEISDTSPAKRRLITFPNNMASRPLDDQDKIESSQSQVSKSKSVPVGEFTRLRASNKVPRFLHDLHDIGRPHPDDPHKWEIVQPQGSEPKYVPVGEFTRPSNKAPRRDFLDLHRIMRPCPDDPHKWEFLQPQVSERKSGPVGEFVRPSDTAPKPSEHPNQTERPLSEISNPPVAKRGLIESRDKTASRPSKDTEKLIPTPPSSNRSSRHATAASSGCSNEPVPYRDSDLHPATRTLPTEYPNPMTVALSGCSGKSAHYREPFRLPGVRTFPTVNRPPATNPAGESSQAQEDRPMLSSSRDGEPMVTPNSVERTAQETDSAQGKAPVRKRVPARKSAPALGKASVRKRVPARGAARGRVLAPKTAPAQTDPVDGTRQAQEIINLPPPPDDNTPITNPGPVTRPAQETNEAQSTGQAQEEYMSSSPDDNEPIEYPPWIKNRAREGNPGGRAN
ncbi:hypothetical protein F5Y16DRAFT_403441 [Xylariaceae sp. FL0255]|nr:hypothetical protein F5Y16DRAFT_403441 [Xylariaceae sp. FL0255]